MPLIAFSIATNARQLERKLTALEKKNLPFAEAQAATRLARMALADVQEAERRDFDRPTPFTLRGFYVKPARKSDPTAEIRPREFAGKGTPAWKYLTPEIMGGTRRLKRFERALEAVLGGSEDFTVPGRGARLNQYGNISQRDIEKLLASLDATDSTGVHQARRSLRVAARKGHKAETYFVGRARGGDGRMLAIYHVIGPGKVEPVLVFTTHAPSFRKRLPYFETVARRVTQSASPVLTEEIAKAVATSK